MIPGFFDLCAAWEIARPRRADRRRALLAIAYGRLGLPSGRAHGGHARAAALSPERRRAIAQAAGRARWAK